MRENGEECSWLGVKYRVPEIELKTASAPPEKKLFYRKSLTNK